jgi:hypothetical protein
MPTLSVTQVPSPLHTSPLTRLPEHTVEPQETPWAYLRHAPEPLHCPSFAQLVAPPSAQSECGSFPSATAPQTPSEPNPFAALVHASQSPSHRRSQQTPSVQTPERHWEGPEQGAPPPRSGWQVPSLARQNAAEAHCVSLVHDGAHDEPPVHR